MKASQNIPFQNWIKDQSFMINPLSRNVKPEAYNLGAHIHHYHEIIYVRKGSGQMTIDDIDCELEDQTLYCIWQGQVHKWKEAEKRREGLTIMFKNDFLPTLDANTLMVFNSALFNRLQKINTFRLKVEEIKYFDWLFELILSEYNQPAPTFGQKQTLQYLVMTLLVKLARKTTEIKLNTLPKTGTSAEVFQSFLLLVEHHYQSNVPLDFYAKKLGYSLRNLNQIIKKHGGQTAKQIVLKRTLTEAKRLIAYTNTSIKEIAYRLGFNNQAYFCYFFKKQVGISPQEYRTNQQEGSH